ncbi:hypothetical protein FVEG_07055 [Fusarium verticillioides 7600]|uniref:Uncharacterized protein n=1 Tax=Gibberella moniliformis (strain M3125 / FGSC 7600) TaxID=334819 RepID=W7M4Z6_GIBM7|nr:hypothetical protein FVEG_07055 [Fusarium verticillioides 7600]EWG46648.1 hypothetical protein FVEG_07055 [Fusarium verticillioides 7600]
MGFGLMVLLEFTNDGCSALPRYLTGVIPIVVVARGSARAATAPATDNGIYKLQICHESNVILGSLPSSKQLHVSTGLWIGVQFCRRHYLRHPSCTVRVLNEWSSSVHR